MGRYKIIIITTVVIVLALMVLPLRFINWGTLSLSPQDTITVTGEAKKDVTNQIASFSAGVSAVNDDKQKAITEVNTKVTGIIASVKKFGIAEEDIKTQNLSVYQGEEPYYEGGAQKYKLGQWRVNNTVEIILRDIQKAGELADLLSQSGANNVYGPNFTVDDTSGSENELLQQAVDNAREKAELLAKSSGRRLGKITNLVEGFAQSPVLYGERYGLGGGAPVEPGTQGISKLVTVTFEMK